MLSRDAMAQSITCLGTLSGRAQFNKSYANAVSDDGRIVVGDCYQYGDGAPGGGITLAFRWTPETGMLSLGDPPDGYGRAYDVSADGSTIVGSWGAWAYRWTEALGLQTVEPADSDGASAWSVSADGSTLVGTAWAYSTGGSSYGFIARSVGRGDPELVPLPAPDGCLPEGAIGISADGSIIAGESSCGVYRWSDARGAELLIPGPPGTFEWVYAMSADGSVIVGESDAFGGCFRWTASNGIAPIGPPPGACGIDPSGLSGDGRVMVGHSNDGDCQGPFLRRGVIWREGIGIEWLDDYLVRQGVDLVGWQVIGEVGGISDNGRFVVGSGIFDNQVRAFLVDRFGPCRADVNDDDRVDGADLGRLLIDWGQTSPATVSDLDESGSVDGADLGEMLSNWGRCPG